MNCPIIKDDTIVHGDSAELLKCLPDESVDLVVTSPPYADMRKKEYGGVKHDQYNDWFLPITEEVKRVLKPTGSFVLNIKENSVNKVKHPYVYDLVLKMVDNGWKWRDEYIWSKPNPFPIKPLYKMKDAFEYIYHFTKGDDFTWNPKSVKVNSKPDTCARIQRGLKQKTENHNSPSMKRYKRNYETFKPSKYDCTKAYPNNIIEAPVGRGKTKHPARFPREIPEFFVNLLSNEGDLVLDPFAGSGTTNAVAKKNCRKTIGFDWKKEYVDESNKRLSSIQCKVK